MIIRARSGIYSFRVLYPSVLQYLAWEGSSTLHQLEIFSTHNGMEWIANRGQKNNRYMSSNYELRGERQLQTSIEKAKNCLSSDKMHTYTVWFISPKIKESSAFLFQLRISMLRLIRQPICFLKAAKGPSHFRRAI